MPARKKTNTTGMDAVMELAAGIAEAVDASQDETRSGFKRAAARREAEGYRKQLVALGLVVLFLDQDVVPVELRPEHTVYVVLLASQRRGGESLAGQRSPLGRSILLTPVPFSTMRPARS